MITYTIDKSNKTLGILTHTTKNNDKISNIVIRIDWPVNITPSNIQGNIKEAFDRMILIVGENYKK